MIPSGASASDGILGVVSGIGELERSVDVHSHSALVLFTSLAFLIPALTAWRMRRIWHCFLFTILTVICAAYQYCSPEAKDVLHPEPSHLRCSPMATHVATHAFFIWVYFCLLQMAFLVMGPEDPHMQWLGKQAVPGSPSVATPHHAPFDAVMIARVVPLGVLCAFHFFHASWDTEEIHWQSLLLNELLLLACCTAFWLHQSRQARAADVLVRFKFWHRLLHHGFIPAMMLFWIFCIMGFTDAHTLQSMWHVVVAFFSVSLLRAVLQGESTSPSAKVFDPSSHNPNVAHVLLGALALILLPTTVIGASFDWCSTGSFHWPTIATTTLCRPGDFFVAIVSVPTWTAVATVFWLIDSTAAMKSSWLQFRTAKTCDLPADSLAPSGQRQLALGRRLGCLLGYSGAFFGLAAALVSKGSALANITNLFCSIMSFGLLMIAMTLTVLSSDPSKNAGPRLRRGFTMLVCLPLMVTNMLLMLAEQCLPMQYQVPPYVYAMTEYLVVLLLSIWPLTWAAEVQDTWQRKASGTFAWPTTDWRFV